MKKLAVLFSTIVLAFAGAADAKTQANVNDPGDGGSGYPWNTGQCAYHLGNLSSWLSGGYSTGWGYWCDSNGLISFWDASNGWRFLGWD